jgi:hypothetical protein
MADTTFLVDVNEKQCCNVLRVWSYEDRHREISCLYKNTMNSANIKYISIFEREQNNKINITLVAYKLGCNINWYSNISIDIKNKIIYCDMRARIFACLVVFFNDSILEITPYDLYCKMIVLYRVDWGLAFVAKLLERVRACKNYKLFKITMKYSPVIF